MGQKTRAPKRKHVPQRTCIACRQVAGKRGLLRLVRTETGVEVDPTGKKAGRGAYLHPAQACWRAVLRGNRIEQALRTQITPENRQALLAYMASLPERVAESETPDAEIGVDSGSASEKVR